MLKPAISPYPQRRGDRALWFWVDLIIFWLSTSALNHALLVSVYDFAQPLTVLLTTGASLLLSTLICYNKYTVIAAVLSPFAAMAAVFAAMGISRPFCEWILDFLPWVGNNMFFTDANKASPYFLPCVLMILFVLTLIFYILVFQLRAMWVYLAGGIVLCIVCYFTFSNYHIGHRIGEEHVLYSLCVLLCCSLYYLVRRQYARATRRLSFARSFAPFQRFFLPFFLVAALVTGLVAPTVLGNTYSDVWVDAVDWMLSQGLSGDFVNSEFMSFYEEKKELGGDIELSNKPLFTVASSAPVHLRSVIYDLYDGRSWTDTLSDDEEIVLETEAMSAHEHGTMTKEPYPQYFSLDEQYVQDNYVFGSKGNTGYPLRALTYTIKDTKMFTRTILSSTYTKRVTFLESRNRILVNGSSALVTNRRTRGQRDNYTVSYLEPLGDTFYPWLRDNRWQSPKVEYLQLPDTLPNAVRELAAVLTGGYDNPYVACTNISNFLSRNQTYTTTPGDVPGGVDFVNYFLFDNRQGYCVYYATAMVVLARAAGYPARYVEGFRVDNYDAGRGRVVTGEYAHAWAEIYFDGVGWMTFDPVTVSQFGSNISATVRPDGFALPSLTSDPSDMDENESSVSSMPSVPSTPDPAPDPFIGEEEPSIEWGRIASILLGVLALIFLVSFFITRYHNYRVHWRRRRENCPYYRVLTMYRELERALRYLKHPRQAYQSVHAYLVSLQSVFEKMDQDLQERGKPVEPRDYAALCRAAVNAVYAAAYSEHEAEEGDRQALLALTLLTERRVKKKLGGMLFAMWWKQF